MEENFPHCSSIAAKWPGYIPYEPCGAFAAELEALSALNGGKYKGDSTYILNCCERHLVDGELAHKALVYHLKNLNNSNDNKNIPPTTREFFWNNRDLRVVTLARFAIGPPFQIVSRLGNSLRCRKICSFCATNDDKDPSIREFVANWCGGSAYNPSPLGFSYCKDCKETGAAAGAVRVFCNTNKCIPCTPVPEFYNFAFKSKGITEGYLDGLFTVFHEAKDGRPSYMSVPFAGYSPGVSLSNVLHHNKGLSFEFYQADFFDLGLKLCDLNDEVKGAFDSSCAEAKAIDGEFQY